MDILERLRSADKDSVQRSNGSRIFGEAADEIARLRHHLTELGKAADAAAMVIATIEAEDTTEEEKLQSIMDAIGTWAPDALLAPTERFFPFEFEVWQDDAMVASASGPRDQAMREAMHYAAQYQQDGPVRVFEVTRTLMTPNVEGNRPPRTNDGQE